MSVRGSWSGWRRVLSGIPQESVLGYNFLIAKL